ncbi:MAG: hypothetical protein WD267_03795 [Balneolales bacterium]
MKLITQLTALILFLTLFIASCELDGLGFDSKPDNRESPFSIKDAVVTPDTVTPGDTATFTALAAGEVEYIEKFLWSGFYSTQLTESSTYLWVADSVLGNREFIVTAIGTAQYQPSKPTLK